ncbi:hypothetical protein BDR03DRAFT_552587 [Suillus americanus]|nr:hypothetical protein BDR03DRAFT_552587 [Suillus americanus]
MSAVLRTWAIILVLAMLWVIVITRLYAMYQQSRKILIFLIVIFLAVNIFNTVAATIIAIHTSKDSEEHILSGTYQCSIGYTKDMLLLISIGWILGIVWEVLTLCFAIWIAVKHFHELRRHSAGGIIRDVFTVLMKTHILYFASFVTVSCLQININLSPTFSMDRTSLEVHTFYGSLQILGVAQMFVLGPRLILGIREHYATLVADADAATDMTSIAFQERVHISTGSGV